MTLQDNAQRQQRSIFRLLLQRFGVMIGNMAKRHQPCPATPWRVSVESRLRCQGLIVIRQNQNVSTSFTKNLVSQLNHPPSRIMMPFNSILNYTVNRVLISAVILISVSNAAAATNANEIPMQYIGPMFAWGAPTNGLRAGMLFNVEDQNGSKIQFIQILVLNAKTNDDWGYVKPPSEKFSRYELQDSNNVVMVPRRGREMAGVMPQTIRLEDLPRTPKFGRNNPVLSGPLFLFQNVPIDLKDFVLQDLYPIQNEGEYTLTIWPTIYHFSTNEQFAHRIDLPPVSMKMHVTSSQQK